MNTETITHINNNNGNNNTTMFLAARSSRSLLPSLHTSRRCLSSSYKSRTTAGSGVSDPNVELSSNKWTANRGPVSWGALGLVAVVAASSVAYYQIERERRLEEAMGKIVTSESEGWSPSPSQLAPRKWKQNDQGAWFPIINDVWGAGVSLGTSRCL